MSGQTSGQLFEPAEVKGIYYPRFRELQYEIAKRQEMVAKTHKSQCMALGGDRRTGKSFLVRDYAATRFSFSVSEKRHIPVLYVQVPAGATKSGVMAMMLGGLGVFGPYNGGLTRLKSRLFDLMSRRTVKLVVLDDVHSLVDRSGYHVLEYIADLFEELIWRIPAIYLLVGPERAIERMLDTNYVLHRVFSREVLEPFRWNESVPPSMAAFAKFIELAEVVVGVPLSSELRRNELLSRIHWATDGVVGHIMKLLQYAADRAEEEGKAEIDVSALDIEFDRRLAKHLQRVNPFKIPINKHFAPEDY